MAKWLSARNLSLALALGVFGAAVLVLSFVFFTPGKYLLIPYAGVVLATTAVIRAEHLRDFRDRFAIGFLSFIIASISLYVAVALSPHASRVPLLGHAWRIALLLAVGVAINLPAARIAKAHLAGDAIAA
jgi:hypothetical protein